MAERRRDTEWSHPPLEPCALALLQEGPWYGAAPTGYKLMRRVSQKQKGSALDLLNKRNGNFNGKRGDQKERTTQLHLQRNGGTPLLLGARFRRQPLAPSGATLRAPGVDRSARPSKGLAVPSMQNCVRVSILKRKERRKNVDHEKAS